MEHYRKDSDNILSHFLNKELIGIGSNGNRIYKAINSYDNKQYAIKKIILNKEEEEEKIINEINIFKSLEHPSIIKFYQSLNKKNKIFIVMEYAEGGDLKSIINKQILNNYEKIKEELIWKWCSQIASALKYLHSKKIIHRDIKSENIFVTVNQNLKLGDFGISKILNTTLEFATSGVGTPYYLSPEICKGENYNFKTDVWMFGCLLYELTTLKKPFQANSINILIDKIINSEPNQIDSEYSNDLKELIFSMLKKSPEERPCINQIFNKIPKFSNLDNIPKIIVLNSDQTLNKNKNHNQTIRQNSTTKNCNQNNSHNLSKISNEKNENILHIPFKSIDKNKLKIEIDPESRENSPDVSQKLTPNSYTKSNLSLGALKLNSKMFAESYSKQKYTPSSHKKDIDKIMKNMKISPLNNPSSSLHWQVNQEKRNKSATRTNSTTANSTPRNIIIQNNSKIELNLQKPDVDLKRGHFRHISLNISSIQSSDHEAVYHLENIEKIENIQFPSPSNNSESMKIKKQTLTPTNSLNVNSKISPKESVMKHCKEIPKSTKVYFEQEPNLIRKTLVKNFLIERYSKEKFILMYNSILGNNKVIDPNMIKSVVGDDYKIAINYLGYLINSSNKKYK